MFGLKNKLGTTTWKVCLHFILLPRFVAKYNPYWSRIKMNEIDSTWKETERRVQNDSYREGAGAGRDETFQNGFDEGYADGYKMGHTLGRLKALETYGHLLGAESLQKQTSEMLTDPKKGDCFICKTTGGSSKAQLPDSVYQTPYEDIKEAQKKSNSNKEEAIAQGCTR